MIRIEGVAEATKFCFQLNHHFSATTHSSRGFSKHDLEEIIERMQATFTGEIGYENARYWWNKWYLPLRRTVVRIMHLWEHTSPFVKIHGIAASKNTVDEALGSQPWGTFMFRLSANNPGDLSLGFVAEKGQIMHLLVQTRPEGFEILFSDQSKLYSKLEEFVQRFKPLRLVYPGEDKYKVFSLRFHM
mmetsp:Transcript_7491/g.10549  ORF Transcript_7491/g.10549 Transcript_7491/m.10549 type:complete len:188 (-) Transcript_7491:147-710(-)